LTSRRRLVEDLIRLLEEAQNSNLETFSLETPCVYG